MIHFSDLKLVSRIGACLHFPLVLLFDVAKQDKNFRERDQNFSKYNPGQGQFISTIKFSEMSTCGHVYIGADAKHHTQSSRHPFEPNMLHKNCQKYKNPVCTLYSHERLLPLCVTFWVQALIILLNFCIFDLVT